VEDALRLARAMAAALDYAHRHQVVHRDIKPENVMLHDGEAMVADFGIAKALSAASDVSLTQTGTAMGTAAYMSPEQAMGEPEIDGRTDIYSLGCVLYEMLAGHAPFTGTTAQAIIARSITEPAPSLRSARPAVPEWVEQAVRKAMEKNPAERYATAAQFAQALGSVGLASTPPGTTRASITADAAAVPKSIAVLPFVNMSADPENEYFTDGMAEEIINALTKIQRLRVAARTSSFAFKGKNADVRTIGEQLNVSAVLEGSVRKAGSRLRVVAQLVNVTDGYHLWSERYDREMEDVFAIQDEIAASIVRALRVVLSDQEKRAIENVPRADVEAYDYYLRGRQFHHQFRRSGIQFARRMFERALDIDPNYAPAHAGAADCCSFLYMYWDASKANIESAESYSRKALELGPDVAEAHASRGLALTLTKAYDQAQAEFQMAIRLNPQLFEAHYFYARALFQQGKFADTVRQYEEASRVRPEDYQALFLVQTSLRRLGRVADAEASLRRGLEVAGKHLELNPDDARALYLGAGASMMLGDRARALDWASRALALDSEDSGVLYNVACVYALGGKQDDALSALEKAVQNGFGHREWLENDTDLDSLRETPRFRTLLQRM
jgi:TolB-like protein/cytochrome c-type biogenesis protein CcmH/NrfG